jgi:hypothetical protein
MFVAIKEIWLQTQMTGGVVIVVTRVVITEAENVMMKNGLNNKNMSNNRIGNMKNVTAMMDIKEP